VRSVNPDWQKKKLSELGRITSSKRIFASEYVKQGIPFYRTKEIKELANDKPITTELFISTQKYNDIKKSFGMPKEGDILLTAIGTIGEMYVVKANEEFYFKDGNVLWLKDFKSLNSYYLRLLLMSFVEQLQKLSHGAAYNALPIEKLKDYEVNLPSIEEQKIIVQKLNALSAETKKLEAIYQQKLTDLDELKKAILQKAFRGELTATSANVVTA
jgi:type I restriction enzyme S subunit